MKYPTPQKGFTMVEMIVVLGIFALMSGIVLFNYGKFRSDTILTNMAYEVALSIREAQIYGVSVRNPNGSSASFSEAYGVYVPQNSNQYILFGDNDTAGDPFKFDGTSCSDVGFDTCVTPYTLLGNITITDVNIKKSAGCLPFSGGLSILFKRPNPEPVIDNDSDISQAEITVMAQDGAKRYILIANNGQIAVTNSSICSI